jgi:hypothetical protein
MPNPFIGQFSITGLQDQLYEAVIYDFTGHICLQNRIQALGGTLTVGTQAINNGIYFLTLYSNNKLLWIQKIIKQE